MHAYMVTGGAGFIGSNLVERLLQLGKTVRVVDNLSTGRQKNIDRWRSDVEFIEADVRDAAAIHRAMSGIEVVLHQAALPSVQRSVDDPITTNAVNITGTLNVLVAARDAGVRRVVVASSSSIYGNAPTQPKVETMRQWPISPYAVSKLATETYCLSFNRVYGLPTIALRYFNVFGPHQDPNSYYAAVIPKFISLMLNGGSPTIYGDGRQSRDFTYVENVIHANLLAAEAPSDCSGVYNVACGESHTLLDLVNRLNNILGVSLTPHFALPAPGDVFSSLADINAAEAALGYRPQILFEEGLRRTVEHLRDAAAPQIERLHLREQVVGAQ